MTVRVLSRSLIGLLSDLIHTADTEDGSPVQSVLLHTVRAGFGDEPGDQDLWCGVSTNRYIAGHTYTPCSGQLDGGPSLWSVRDARSVIAVFKTPAKDEGHIVDIRRDGDMITVREDPNLFDDGLSLTFCQLAIDIFPGVGLYHLLNNERPSVIADAERDEGEALPRIDFTAEYLQAFVKVATRRKEPLRLYRTHQTRRVLVQVGQSYRGLIAPVRYEPDGAEDTPDAELHAPDLHDLERRVELAREGAKPAAKPASPPALTLLPDPDEDDEP